MSHDFGVDPEQLTTEIEHTNRNVSIAIILVAITSFVQLVAILSNAYNEYQDRKAQAIEKTLDRKISTLEFELNKKLDMYSKITYAMIELRGTNQQIQILCTDKSKFIPNYQQLLLDLKLKRIQDRVSLTQAMSGSHIIFNQNVSNSIQEFVNLQLATEAILDPCAPGSPSTELWRQKQLEINGLMGDSINQTLAEIKQAQGKSD